MKRITLLALAICLATLSINAQNVFQLKVLNQEKDSRLSEKVLDYQIVEFDSKTLFDFRQQFENDLSFEFKIGVDKSRIFNVQAKEMRSDDYVLQTSENNELKSFERNRTAVFQGELRNQNSGSAIFTIDENFIMGFWQEGEIVYYLEPLWRLQPNAPHNQYVLYQEQDAVIPEGFCGVSEEALAVHRKQHNDEQPQEKIAGPCLGVDIALASDFEMFEAFGSAASVESFMLGTLANVQTNYDDEFDNELHFQVVTTFIVTSNASDPWTNSADAGFFLEDFTDWANGGGFGGIAYDVASAWTDRNFAGSTVGVAWLGSICTGGRYNVLERFTNNAVSLRVMWAHELGHNFDADHDSSTGFIMSPSVNSSTVWSTFSQNRINAFVPTRACLTSNCGGGGTTEAPEADFSASPQFGCAPLEVEFQDDSFGVPDEWEWSFDGGTPSFSNLQNPTVTYNTPGVYTVSLFVANSEGTNTRTEFDFITVLDFPIPDFSVTVTGFDAEFFNLSVGGDFYEWDFGDGSFSSEESPFHPYEESGEYFVTLTVSNDCGTETYTEAIIIESILILDFDVSATTGCAPLEIDFFDTSEGNPDFWEWSFNGGDPETSTFASPVVTYNTAGIYDVVFTAGNEFESSTITREAYIEVFPNAIADFNVSIEDGNHTPVISNNSIDATTYSWDFGDSETSTDVDPTHTYEAAGEYTITLIATNSCGSNTVSHTVVVTDPVSPSFTISAAQGCVAHTVVFEASPQADGNTYTWTFEGGVPATSSSPNPTVLYEAVGSFDVSLMITNSTGSGTETKEDVIVINNGPTAAFTSANEPGSADVAFTNTSSNAASYVWIFGDDSANSTMENPSHSYESAGTYNVSLTATNECGTSTKTEVIVIIFVPEPAMTISATTGCAPLTVSYVASPVAEGNTYAWVFTGGSPASSTVASPSVVYNSAGTYSASLTVTNVAGSATVTETDILVVNNGPTAGFTSVNELGSADVAFTNTSSNAASYVWVFGDDSANSTMENPSHNYESAGTYNVRLTATNECGTSTKTEVIVIVFVPEPAMTISATTGCAPLTVSYAASPVAEGNTYAWVFTGGSPASSTVASPSVVYSSAGTYSASLTVTNIAGSATVTETDVLVVNNEPTAAFTSVNEPGSADVAFTNTSSNAASYVWIFGDDSANSTMENPSHHYESAGTYNVSLTATNECGTSTKTEVIVIVFIPEPAITISTTTGCAPLAVSYTASPVTEGNTYEWVFTGGSPATSTIVTPSVVYTSAGTYSASLTVTNVAGSATVTETDILVVNNGPTAGFTSVNELGSADVAFTNTSSNAASYVWVFGDDSANSTMENPSHNYESAGTYNVRLTATNECGTSTKTEVIVIVFVPEPAMTISATTGCAPLTVSYAASPVAEGNTYAWVFTGGNPSVSTEVSPSITYSDAGTYTASLTVTNAAGSATVTEEDILVISSAPTASFTFNVNGLTADFTNTSSDASSFSWEIAGTIIDEDNPSFTFPNVGEYEAILTVGSACGSSEFTAIVVVEGQAPTVSFVTENNEGCAPLEVGFTGNVEGADTFEWSFEGGNPATATIANPTVTYNAAGVYSVTLTATNVFGTTTTTLPGVVIIYEQTVADFSFDLNGTTAQFQSNSTGENSTAWLFSDGTTSAESEPTFTFPGNGVYEVTLAAGGPCNTDTEVQTITIDGALPVIEIVSDKQEGCLPLTITFTDVSTGSPTSREWTFTGGDPATSNESSVEVTYNTVGLYPVSLVVGNEFGSTQQDWADFISVIDVPVMPDFVMNTVDGLSGVAVVIDPDASYTYNWDFGNGQTAIGESAEYVYAEENTYTVTLVATNDCGEVATTQEFVAIVNSVNTPVWASSLSLFPNPTQGHVQLKAKGWPTSGEIGLNLVNILGQKIEQQQFEVLSGQWNQSFDWSHLPAGTYMLQLKWGTEVWSQKVIKL